MRGVPRTANGGEAKPLWAVYPGRFALAYLTLGIVVSAAIIGLAVAVKDIGPGGNNAAWSTWHPAGGGGLGIAQQIASHVGGEYRLGNGTQLDDVIARPPIVSINNHSINVGYVAIHGGKHKSDVVSSTSSSSTVLYSLCGLGPSCSIATGKPSVERGRLVRREIVELALYTFHYESGIHNVIAFMPPTTGAQPLMVFLQRSDLDSRLAKPLAATLQTRTATVSSLTPSDITQVDELTDSRSYSWTLTQSQDGNAVFVLRRR